MAPPATGLKNVVSGLLRAQMGSAISNEVGDDELDKAIMDALVREARSKDDKYNSKAGIRAFLESAPVGTKTNKRFLSTIIRSTDDHNKAVIQAQRESAEETKAQRDQLEREARQRRAAEAVRERANDVRKRRERSWERRPDDEAWDAWRPGEDKRSTRARRSSPSREREPERHRKRRHRSRSRSRSPTADGKHSSSHHHKRRHRHDTDADDDSHRSHRRRRRDTSRSRSPRRARSPIQEPAHGSASPGPQPAPPSPQPSPPPKRVSSKPETDSRHKKSRAPRPPSPPGPPPPPIPSGSSLPLSKMDKYFAPDYDPRLDIETEVQVPKSGLVMGGEYDAWEAALELIRVRREDKLRKKSGGSGGASGSSSKRESKAESASATASALDIQYAKRGAMREWDVGKEVT